MLFKWPFSISWQDSLKNALGMHVLTAKLVYPLDGTHITIRLSKGCFHRKRSDSKEWIKSYITWDHEGYWIEDWDNYEGRPQPSDRQTLIKFLNHWKKTFEVYLNGVKL